MPTPQSLGEASSRPWVAYLASLGLEATRFGQGRCFEFAVGREAGPSRRSGPFLARAWGCFPTACLPRGFQRDVALERRADAVGVSHWAADRREVYVASRCDQPRRGEHHRELDSATACVDGLARTTVHELDLSQAHVGDHQHRPHRRRVCQFRREGGEDLLRDGDSFRDREPASEPPLVVGSAPKSVGHNSSYFSAFRLVSIRDKLQETYPVVRHASWLGDFGEEMQLYKTCGSTSRLGKGVGERCREDRLENIFGFGISTRALSFRCPFGSSIRARRSSSWSL